MATFSSKTRRPRVIGRWIKRQMPKTLFGRSLLIIVLPVAIMQIAVTYVFFDNHWQTVTSRLPPGGPGRRRRLGGRELSGRPQRRLLRQDLQAGRGFHGPVSGPAARSHASRPHPPLAVRPHRPVDAAGALGAPRRPAVLVRHHALPRLRRHPRRGARRGDAHPMRFPRPGLRHPGSYLRPLDDGGDGAVHRHRHPLHPQPSEGHRAPGQRRGGLRARRRGDRLQAAWRSRGAPRRHRLPRHARPHPALHRTAHHPAGLGQPRPAHAADPPEAGAGAGRALQAHRRHEGRPRRDGAHDRRVPGLRPRRGAARPPRPSICATCSNRSARARCGPAPRSPSPSIPHSPPRSAPTRSSGRSPTW